ncbi:hypothetical protein NPX13_g10357 [Xylaria arbuscula]|uniref:Uncharacterized protein n=1 Tax=Xylaria arbuscula TaxID=114810 RepID=A0A9W8N4Y8_9PEZI|nr:hypothetical protein NPX13_g10357 [Xylaria arbuscula]
MAGIQYPLPPDLATLEDYCDKWAQWAAHLKEIKAQYTDQAKLSAIQDEIDTIKAEIKQVEQRLQERIQDRNAAIREGWELYRADLTRHLRVLPPTALPRLGETTSFGSVDREGRNQAPLPTRSDSTGRPIWSQVPRADSKSAALDSLVTAALLHHDAEAAGSNPNKPAPYSFFEESSRASAADYATTICSSPSGSIFNHRAPHSSPVIPNGIKQENKQSLGGLATYSSPLRAYGQTPQLFDQPKPADRQISPAERSSPTIPLPAGIPPTPASERSPDDRDVW